MAGLFHFLQQQPFIVIFGVLAAGMALGRVAIAGISLGSVVCILFVGLIVSTTAFNLASVSLELPGAVGTVFFNMFIFAVGLKVGPQFFAGLERDGWHMVAIGLTVSLLAPIVTYACVRIFDLPVGAAAGVLAGSNNSSSAFGTATSAVQSGGGPDGASTELLMGTLSAAFALCYAVSEVQFVLFMKWLPRMAGIDPAKDARAFEATVGRASGAPLPGTAEAADVGATAVTVRAYRVSSASIDGLTIATLRHRAPHATIELVRRSTQWIAVDDQTTLARGDEVVVSAPLAVQIKVRESLGPELADDEARRLVPVQTVDVIVQRPEVAGHTLAELASQSATSLQATGLFRAGAELPPESPLKFGDVVRVTGTARHVGTLEARVGQVVRATHASDVLTLAIGLLVGGVVAAIPLPLFGLRLSLGAAAMLMTGILFGWIKTRHPAFGGPISEGGRRLMEGLGLNVFTAILAINSGRAVYEVMRNGPVWSLAASCLIISGLPSLVAWWFGRHVLGLNHALLMGAIAGARQNTASLHVAQNLSRSAVPGIGYPVPLAVATLTLSVIAYLFALSL